MNKLKKMLINFILYIKYGYKSSSKRYYKYLNNKGIKLGKNVKFYSPWSISIDIQRPWMIEIGDNVHITSGCRILQHGYDWCVLQHKYGDVLGSSGKVTIGNNVFIGVETTILKGVTIGNDVIIGAKTLVNKDCIEPGVYAGNPVRFIMSIDEYYEKRKQRQIKEATELMKEYYNKYGNYPKKELLREFFWLFEERKTELNTTFMDVINLEGNEKISMQSFLNSKPVFNGYNEFIKYVGGNYDSKNKKMIPNNVKFYINKCLKPAKFIHYLLLKPKFKECCNQYNIKFQTDVETVNQIINEKKSLSRFGDGEMLWTLNIEHRSYQKSSEELTKKLKEVLQNKNKNLIIGLPNLLDKENLNKYNLDCRIHWVKFITSKFKEFIKFVDRDRIYADTQITRCYIDYKDKSFTKERYANLERIWYEKEVLIVEGEKTRLGIGNDLFSNAKKIERIICPSTNAFDKYEEILNAIKKNGKNKIIILALGPTATILAKDICDLNGDKIEYQALDLGHIDIEYEWFLMRAKKRKAVKGKYVNEVWKKNLSDVSLNKNDEIIYNESIICRINN